MEQPEVSGFRTSAISRTGAFSTRGLLPFPTGSPLPWLLLALIAVLVLYPLGMVVYSSFRNSPPGSAGTLTLDPWLRTLSNPDSLNALLTTFRIVLPKVALAMTVATFFGWILARTNTPARSVLMGLLAFMFFVPNLPWVLAWIHLISPRTGLLNQLLGTVLPGGFRFNAYSYEALVILGAMHAVPILFLLIYPAFRNMDATLEESSLASGATRWQTTLRVTLPLLAPALLATAALSTVVGMESFETEQLLGVPAGIFVFTTRIYDFLYNQQSSEFGPASALSMVLVALTLLLVILQRRILAGRSYTSVTGRGYQPNPTDLGPWRWLTFSLVVGYFVVFGVAPIIVLLLTSFMQVSGFFTPELLTTRVWTKVLSSTTLTSSIQNTVLIGVFAATIGVVIAALAAYLITRFRWGGRPAMDTLVWLPIAVPGLVLALGFLWAYVGLPIYGTVWILVLAYVVRGLPTSSRFFTSTMVQISAELEEASRVHGATWLQTFFRVWQPLLRPALVGAWIFLFVIAVRSLDAALLLTGPTTEVLSVSIFQQASRGDGSAASALAIIQTGIISIAYLLVRPLLRRPGSDEQSTRPTVS
jgi:iron(III) transport system permease protein